MKKIYLLLCLCIFGFTGWGQQLLYEPFSYTVDATLGLSAQSANTWAIINTGDSILLSSGSLSYTGLQASTGNRVKYDGSGTDYYVNYASQTTGSVYSSFILNVTSLGTLGTTGGYFAGVLQSGSTSAFGASVWTRASTTAGKFNIGISTRSNSAVTWLPNELDPGTSYFIVTAYDIVTGTGNDVARIWLNTTAIGGAEPAADATAAAGTDLTSVARYFLRQDNPTNTPFIEFDELRVGTTWASVTPGSAVVATPTITTIAPTSATAGGSAFTLTVNGTNFTNASTVTWNGANRTTTFVSATQLTAAITAADIAAAGTATVGVTTTGAPASSNTVTFTINAATVPTLSATTLTSFGSNCINTTAGPNSYTLTGVNLSAANVTVAALAGYTYATSSGGTYTSTLTLTPTAGALNQTVYVKFTPTAAQSYAGNIAISGGGATAINVAADGTGINTATTVTTGPAGSITTSGATLPGTITVAGCSATTAYGIEYSTTNGFANGTGIQVPSSNLASGSFSSAVSGLAAATTYYYKAYVTSAAGTVYGAQQSFTTSAAPPAGAPVATAATNISSTGFTANWNGVTGATGYRLDVYTLGGGSSVTDLAGWSFTSNTVSSLTADVGNANNIGIQTVTSTGLNTISYPGGPTSSSGANPNSVSANGWDNGANTKYWQVDVNTTGATGITVSSLQGSSSTGPSAFQVQYKVGAGAWIDVAGGAVSITQAVAAGNAATWSAVSNLALPAAADNQALVSIRWISTSNVSVGGGTVSATGTSRISAIYIKGTTAGSAPVYVTGYQNLAVGNVLTYNVTGLAPNTTYYYVVRAENGSGSSANSNQITVVTASSPSLSAGTLTAFGATCTNTTAGPNSFTITGTNLSSGNITVGPLAGYTFSTTSGGTYTSTLSLSQTGGAYSQAVFVKFTPTAVQSYNGNIAISGGGVSAAINVAASGSGVNTTPTVVTGAASAITTSGATLAGSISANGCTTVTAYGIEYSTTSGFANGTGIQVPATNIASGAYSVTLATLASGTTYYYKAYATNGGGTAWGAENSFTTSSLLPTITTTALTAFGNVCLNTASTANSFTINGTNLTTANVVVGPLAGYTFSTTAGGTYTNSLALTQTGGTYTQTVFVKLTPTAVASYNGNIPVTGGGATATTNVAVTGAGVNTAPTVVTGTASAITTTGATLAGTISNTGCTAVTAYGIEFSTTNGFANGTGTQVPSTNLAAGAYSSTLSTLAPSTTYYYKAYATNGGGTSWGTQQSFTTAAPPPAAITTTALAAFGTVCVNTTTAANSLTITGTNLTNAPVTVGPLAGFAFSTTAGGTYTPGLSITQPGGSFTQTVYVQFTPTAAQSYSGNIPVNGGGLTATVNVAVSATGGNTPITVTTGAAASITTGSATLSGTVSGGGCSVVTNYGIEYSGINNFVNGSGTKVAASNLNGTAFSANLSGLVQGATYYYRAYAYNGGLITYGAQQSFTVKAIPDVFTVYPVPVVHGAQLNFSVKNLNPGYYGFVIYNSAGQKLMEKGFNVQSTYMDDKITVPYNIPFGVYTVELVNGTNVIGKRRIMIF